MKTIAVVVPQGVIAFDLAIACEILGRVRLAGGEPGYQVLVCGSRRSVPVGGYELRVARGLQVLAAADTVVVPGIEDIDTTADTEVVRQVRAAWQRGARIASICTGAFVLAQAGVLDGLRATTHWMAADALAARYPAIRVDPAALFVDQGQVLTSAGAAAGIDLCLHMVRLDYGSAVAAMSARLAVVPLGRDGGQAQFIRHPPPRSSSGDLQPVLQWIEAHLAQAMDIAALADRFAQSRRTLHRRFMAQTGLSPLRWVIQARIRRAQALLETTDLPVDQVAFACGFGSATLLRQHFSRLVGTSPQNFRRTFGQAQISENASSTLQTAMTVSPVMKARSAWASSASAGRRRSDR